MPASDQIAHLLGAPWFLAVELIATGAIAVAGTIVGWREGYSLFGALVLAALPAVGGGLMRDILVGRHPPAALAKPIYLLTVIATVGICYAALVMNRAFERRSNRFPRLRRLHLAVARRSYPEEIVVVCDAAGLGAFTLVGVWVAFAYGCEPLWLWGPLLATMTTAGGGILRDILRADRESTMLKTSLYAEIAIVGGLAMTVCIDTFREPDQQFTLLALVVAVAVACAVARIVTHACRISAPSFRPRAFAEAQAAPAAGMPVIPAHQAAIYPHAQLSGGGGTSGVQLANSNPRDPRVRRESETMDALRRMQGLPRMRRLR